MVVVEVIRLFGIESYVDTVKENLRFRIDNGLFKLLVTSKEDVEMLKKIMSKDLSFPAEDFTIISVDREAFSNVGVPLNSAVSYIQKELKSIEWIFFTSLGMNLPLTSYKSLLKHLSLTDFNVVGIYLREHTMFEGIAYDIPWNTACAWKITNDILIFENTIGMEEYRASLGRKVSFITLEYNWRYVDNEKFRKKMSTKNARLLESLGVDKIDDLSKDMLIKVTHEHLLL